MIIEKILGVLFGWGLISLIPGIFVFAGLEDELFPNDEFDKTKLTSGHVVLALLFLPIMVVAALIFYIPKLKIFKYNIFPEKDKDND